MQHRAEEPSEQSPGGLYFLLTEAESHRAVTADHTRSGFYFSYHNMADGKLIFPVKFDLQSAVREAQGDVDKILRRLETQINSRPLKIKIDGGFTNMGVIGGYKDSIEALTKAQQTLAKDGSIQAMRKEMSALILEWEKLSEKERTATDASGKFSGRAGKIVARFAELTAAANTHARSLNQLVSAADKAAGAEERLAQKRAETANRLAALKNPNMDSLTEVKASLKHYEQLAGSAKQFSAGWEICVQKIKELKARSQELSDIYKTMTRQNVFNMPEGNLNEVKDKIKALKIQMEQATPNSTAWNEFANQMSRLREVEKGMVAEQKQAIKTESELRAEREKAALQELANQRKIKAERAKNVSGIERERATRRQLIAQKRQELAVLNGEERSLDQVNAKLEIRRRLLASSKEGTRFYDTNWNEVNRLEEKQRGMQANTPEAQRKAQEQLQKEWLAAKDQREREREKETEKAIAAANRENQARQASYNVQRQTGLERQRILNLEENSIANITAKLQLQQERLNNAKFGTSKYEKIRQEVDRLTISLQEAQKKLAESGQHLAALRALREILAANEKTVSGLNQKLQYFQDRLSRLETGSAKWVRTAAEVRRLSDELERANQKMRDFQNAAFKGLSTNFTARQTEAVTRLRTEIDAIDRKFNMLYQNGRATNADGSYTDRVRAMLDERIAKEKEINRILTSAADAQIQREKELSRIQEQRKARAQAIADKRKAETQAVQKNIAAQKEERRILNQKESSIKSITDKLAIMQRRLNSTDIKSGGFEKIAKEVERLTRKLDEYKRKIAEATERSTSGSSTQAKNARKVSQEYSRQLGYIDRLIRRMAVYASVGMIGNFLTKIREVTAQFELQRISLGAILQDQNKANQLFSEIKSFALKSPVSILDLTKYTKQLAAYKIGYDELFETTKRLTDVSVGLGVSMDRIILMYGQIRATGYLRASEVRQATEAGIPLVEELAKKLSEANGELVTASQVLDMISKRQISFEMVKEVFEDMTNAGGIFYNMQEKQGNTLYGLWAKLGDAASVMYSEIGNTGPVNDGMKSLISGMTSLMKDWRLMIGEVAVAAAGFGAYKLEQSLVTVNTIAASRATRDYARAQVQLNAVQASGSKWAVKAATASMRAAAANRAAALSTNLWTAAKFRLVGAVNTLKGALMGNWLTLAITAVAAIIVAIGAAIEKATRLNRKINEIKGETSTLQAQSVRNFEYLAKEATAAADGSKKQKDALDELTRTYGEMLPKEALRIENLREMSGGYQALTQAIRENIAAQQADKMRNAIKEEVGAKITGAQKDVGAVLKIQFGLDDKEIDRFILELEKRVQKTGKVTEEIIEEIAKKLNLKFSKSELEYMSRESSLFDPNFLQKYAAACKELNVRLGNVSEWARTAALDLGAYNAAMENYNKTVASNLKAGDTMLQNQQNIDMQVKYMGGYIRAAMQNAGLLWKNEWANVIESVNPEELNKTTTLNMEAILAAIDPNKYPELYNYVSEYKRLYDDLIPPDPTVQQIRAKLFEIAGSTGAYIDKMRQFLWDGKNNVDEHLKTLQDQIEQYEAELAKLQATFATFATSATSGASLLGGKIEETTKIVEALKEQAAFVKTYTVPEKSKNKGGSKSDTRLQELQEINQTLEKINKEYDDLQKKEGKTKALEDIKELFKDTLDYTNKLGEKFGLHFDFPTEFKSLQQYRQDILKVMKSLKKLKGGEKAILEFQTMIGKADSDKLQAQIEAQLNAIADKISRTKTAKEFYEKILEQTGDIDIATRVSMSIYGSTGEELFNDTVEQIREAFKTGSEKHPIDLDISAAIDLENQRIDYKKLADIYDKYQDEIIEERRDTAKKIATEGQKEVATNIANWQNELAKAQSFEGQRTAIIKRESEKRAKIIKETRDPQERNRLVSLSYDKQAQELAKLAVDEFKSSDDYIKVFQDLDRVSSQTLDRMKKRLQEMIATVKDTENVDGLKSLIEQLDKIKEERETRNPVKGVIDSFKEYAKARKDFRTAEANEAKVKAEFAKQELGLNTEIQTAIDEQAIAQKRVTDLEAQGKLNTDEGVAAQLALDNATTKVTQATEKRNEAVKKVNDAEQATTDALDDQKSAIADLSKHVNAMADAFSSGASSIQTIADMMGVAEDSELGDIVNGLVSGLNNAATIMTTILAIAIAIESACWWLLAIGGAIGAFSAIGSWLTGSKVRKANKEIERQQDLLDQLEYTYGRLEKAADKAFGTDYVNNYQQRIKNLQAQQQAYQKQAEAERSKGKKEDEEKTKEYLENARETADEIKELQDELVAHFTGSSKTDIARQMAQSWIDARASMSDTFAALEGDYADMIKNMIVEGAAARVIENALSPMWEDMDRMLQDNDVDGAIDSLINGMDAALTQANNGMEVLWQALEAKGYDMKKLIGDTDSEYTGIAKSVAGATSEEINNVAAIGNTLMYYVSPIPRIDENLARVVAIMEGKGAALPTVSGVTMGAVDYTDLFNTANQHLSSLPRMEQHLAEIHTLLNRVIVSGGGRFGVNTFIKQ